jgi:hypothetical protein
VGESTRGWLLVNICTDIPPIHIAVRGKRLRQSTFSANAWMLQCFHLLAAYLSCFSGAKSFKRDTSVFRQSHSLTVSRLSLPGMWQVQSARRLITEGAVGDAALARLSEASEHLRQKIWKGGRHRREHGMKVTCSPPSQLK